MHGGRRESHLVATFQWRNPMKLVKHHHNNCFHYWCKRTKPILKLSSKLNRLKTTKPRVEKQVGKFPYTFNKEMLSWKNRISYAIGQKTEQARGWKLIPSTDPKIWRLRLERLQRTDTPAIGSVADCANCMVTKQNGNAISHTTKPNVFRRSIRIFFF